MKQTFTQREVIRYYADCGKDLKERDFRSFINHVRGFPSMLYQNWRIRETINLIKKLPSKKPILDAPCGSGYMLSDLPKGSIGLEINPRHVKAARKNAPLAKVIEGDLEKLPFPNSSFEMVIAAEIFEHVPKPRKIIQELWRVLRKNGFFVVTVPTSSPLWNVRFLASSMAKTEPFLITFTRKQIENLFSKYKIKIVTYQTIAFGLNHYIVFQKNEK